METKQGRHYTWRERDNGLGIMSDRRRESANMCSQSRGRERSQREGNSSDRHTSSRVVLRGLEGFVDMSSSETRTNIDSS